MAFITQKSAGTALTDRTMVSMTGDGSDTTLTLSSSPDSVMDCAIYLDGIMQRPGVDYTLSGDTITFTTAPANGVFVCAMVGGSEDIGTPLAGSVDTDHLVDGAVTDAKIAGMSSSKLTGTLPAVDGSALTNVSDGITRSANDPALNTNPSAVGALFLNTTDGEMFVCTDATTDANVWKNVGLGSGNIMIDPYIFAGTTTGYTVKGRHSLTNQTKIDKWSFASATTNAASPASLSQGAYSAGAYASATHGYSAGGLIPDYYAGIEKFSFANEGTNSVTPATLIGGRNYMSNHNNADYGFNGGGAGYASGSSGPVIKWSTVNKFAFASETNEEEHCSLTGSTESPLGNSCTGVTSNTDGYVSAYTSYTSAAGGGPTNVDDIWKFSQSSGSQAQIVSQLTEMRGYAAGSGSETHGFYHGGNHGPYIDTIDSFLFANETETADHGNLTQARGYMAGSSFTTHGYTAGGDVGGRTDRIDRFPYNNPSANASDVGDLTDVRNHVCGTQY